MEKGAAAREVRDVGMEGLMWACASVSRKKMGGKKGAAREVRDVGMGGLMRHVREREREGEGGGVKLIYIGKWEGGGSCGMCCFCFSSALCS